MIIKFAAAIKISVDVKGLTESLISDGIFKEKINDGLIREGIIESVKNYLEQLKDTADECLIVGIDCVVLP